MRLGDVLAIAIDEPLCKFRWGDDVVQLVNKTCTTLSTPISASMTGDEVFSLLKACSDGENYDVLMEMPITLDGSRPHVHHTRQWYFHLMLALSLVMSIVAGVITFISEARVWINVEPSATVDPATLDKILDFLLEAIKTVSNESKTSD